MPTFGLFGAAARRAAQLPYATALPQEMAEEPIPSRPRRSMFGAMAPPAPEVQAPQPAMQGPAPTLGMFGRSAPKPKYESNFLLDAFGYKPETAGMNGLEWWFSSPTQRDAAAKSVAAKQAAADQQEQMNAQIQALQSAGYKPDQIIAFMNNPEKWSESLATNLEAANVGGGDSRFVNGKFMTAPKFGIDGGFSYTQTPEGITWGDRRDMSYGEENDAANTRETGRHNLATENIDRDRLAFDRKKQETDALIAQLPDFGNENQLRSQYLGQAKNFQTVRDAFQRIQAVGQAKNPAEQMSLIFAYMKMLDPGSTVREGEYATAQNTTGVPGWIMNSYNKAKDGVFLNETQVNDFLNQAKAQYKTAEQTYGGVLDQYRELAQRYRMPENIIQDMRGPGAPGTPRELKRNLSSALRQTEAAGSPWPTIRSSIPDNYSDLDPETAQVIDQAFSDGAPTPDDVSDLLEKYK